jgi:hypothetical protein
MDHVQAAPTSRDEELAAEAKQRARDQHHWLRSATSLPKPQSSVVYGGGHLTFEGRTGS